MKALITGASSGLGREMAKILADKGYDLVIAARRKELLEELKNEIGDKVQIQVEQADVSVKDNCINLFERHKDIDLLINNAGFGLFGNFVETDLDKELSMIETNISGLHILTKLYLQEMQKKNSGSIMNISSIAGFMPAGPLMSTYYATKSYVLSLTRAINTELKKQNSNVKMYALCPGPFDSNFFNVAGVHFGVKPMSSEAVAKYGIEKMLKGKTVIVPGFTNKMATSLVRFAPYGIFSNIVYKLQQAKSK